MMVLMYCGQMIFFEKPFNLITTPERDEDGPTSRLVLDTLLFHTFILMNLFNQINCRVVDPNELNVFKSLFNNPIFWVVLSLEVGLQQLMINAGHWPLGSALLGTAPLTANMVWTAWGLGALSLGVNVGIKKIPLSLFEFTKNVDLETENQEEFINKYMAKGEAFVQSKKSSLLRQEE
jgi:magnesium-transporting ATPase (P-type)